MTHTCTIHTVTFVFQIASTNVYITTILLFLIGFAEIKHTTDIINMYLHMQVHNLWLDGVAWTTLIAKCSISTNCTHHIMQTTRSSGAPVYEFNKRYGYITEQNCYINKTHYMPYARLQWRTIYTNGKQRK